MISYLIICICAYLSIHLLVINSEIDEVRGVNCEGYNLHYRLMSYKFSGIFYGIRKIFVMARGYTSFVTHWSSLHLTTHWIEKKPFFFLIGNLSAVNGIDENAE